MQSLDLMLDRLVAWDSPSQISTERGPRLVRRAVPTDRFWTLWNSAKPTLRAAGVQVQKIQGRFVIEQCLSPEGEAPEKVSIRRVNEMGLKEWQPKPVALLTDALLQYNFAVDASDTGTGKTYVACGVARELCAAPLVICPKAVIPAWQAAADSLGVKLHGCINYELVRNGNTDFMGLDETYGYPEFYLPAKTPIFFDEGHRGKSPNSLNCKVMVAAIHGKFPVMIMSATLFESPLHMKATGYGLGFHHLRDFYPWAKAHGCYVNQWDKYEFNGSRKHLVKIHNSIFGEGRGVRVRRADIPGFPDNQTTVEILDMGDGIAKAYKIMATRLKALEEAGQRDHARAEGKASSISKLTEQLRARQKIELLKVPSLIELVKDAVDEGQSVAVFVNFSETIEALHEKLKDAVFIRGGQKDHERVEAIAGFQSDKHRVILCNIEAGGVGVSLHDLHGNFPRLALICPTYNGASLKQALGRIHRAEGRTKSIQKIIFAANSIEEDVAKSVKRKIANIDLVNDGDFEKL